MVLDLNSQVVKLKEQVDYAQFYSQFPEFESLTPNSSGQIWSLCPFHADGNASFMINLSDGRFTCWSKCVRPGDLIDFYMAYFKVPYMRAITEIAKQVGFELEFDEEYKEEQQKKRELVLFNNKLMKHFQENLQNSSVAMSYLKEDRGLTLATIRTFKLGFFNPNTIMNHIPKEEYDIAIKCGVLKRNENGTVRPFSKVERVIFPYLVGNYPVTFTSRVIDDSISYAPKYQNFNNNEYVKKEEQVYGLDTAKETIEKYGFVFLSEGQLDCIKAHQNGVKNVVSISGIKISESQVLKLRKHTKRFRLIVEDEASFKHIEACHKTIKSNIPHSKLYIVKLFKDKKMDLDSFLETHSVKDFIKIATDAKTYNEFVVEDVLRKYNPNDVEDKDRVLNILRPHLVGSIMGDIERSKYIERIAETLETPIQDITRRIRSKEIMIQQQQFQSAMKHVDNQIVNKQKFLIALLFYGFDIFTMVEKFKTNSVVEHLLPEYKVIFDKAVEMLNEGNTPEYIKTYLETDVTYKNCFIDSMNKLSVIMIDEDEVDEYLQEQVESIIELKREEEIKCMK